MSFRSSIATLLASVRGLKLIDRFIVAFLSCSLVLLAVVFTAIPSAATRFSQTDKVAIAQRVATPERISVRSIKAIPIRSYDSQRYVTVAGDTLSEIAKKLYHDPSRWIELWWINRGKIPNPNVLLVGISLNLSSTKPTSAVIRRANAAVTPMTTTSISTSSGTVTPTSPGSYGSVPPAFFQCVEQRESGGDPSAYNASSTAAGLFGMELTFWDGINGGYFGRLYPGGASTAPSSVQITAFEDAYAEDGPSPWAPYDGC